MVPLFLQSRLRLLELLGGALVSRLFGPVTSLKKVGHPWPVLWISEGERVLCRLGYIVLPVGLGILLLRLRVLDWRG
jgi:hypothetical protein